MKKLFISIFAIILCIMPLTVYSQDSPIFVNVAALGNNNGTSWLDAYTDLNVALRNAEMTGKNLWVATGIYSSDSLPNAFKMVAGVNVYGGFAGNETSLVDRNVALYPTYLSGNDSCQRVLYGNILSAQNAAVWDGFVIQNGNTDHTYFTDKAGAGVYLKGKAYIKNCTVTNNDGDNAVYANSSESGYTSVYVNVSNCKIINNYCDGLRLSYAEAGACVVSNNNGNGIYITNSSIVDNSTVSENALSGVVISSATIRNSHVLNNHRNGIQGTSFYAMGCVVANNRYNGIYSSVTSNYIINSTVVNNGDVDSVGTCGIYVRSSSKIINSIVWGNEDAYGSSQLNVSLDVSVTYSAIQGGCAGTGNINLNAANSGFDDNKYYPFFVEPSAGTGVDFSGGNFTTFVLSSAINKGNNDAVLPTFFKDIAGNTRIYADVINRVDIGAYELQRPFVKNFPNGIVYVTQAGAGDGSGVSWSNAMNSVQEAAAIAYLQKVDSLMVWVAAGTYYGTGSVIDNAFSIYKNVDVYGGFAGNETFTNSTARNAIITNRDLKRHVSVLDGQNSQRVLAQAETFTPATATRWDGFTIQNGRVQYVGVEEEDSPLNAQGAGVYLDEFGILSNCIVENNTVTGDDGLESSRGGGIYAETNAKVSKCIIRNNYSSTTAAGIYAGVGSVISNCLVSNNTSGVKPNGAAVFAEINAVIENTTIVNNKSQNSSASAVYLEATISGDSIKMKNCIVWGNETSTQLAISGTYKSVDYCAFEGQTVTGTNNINLAADNEGVDAYNYICFKNPVDTKGVISHNDDDYGSANWSLKYTSAAINAGNKLNLSDTLLDVANYKRVVNDTVDLGCYELQNLKFTTATDAIIYVTEDGTGDGSSWDKACSDLNYAVNQASAYNVDNDLSLSNRAKIWVKTGTYYGDRVPCHPAFKMKKKVDVYGGFAGTEAADFDISLRNFSAYPTILDGQDAQRVLLQDGYEAGVSGSTNRWGFLDADKATWDGFYLQNGYTACHDGSETPNNVSAYALINIKYYRNRGAGAYLQYNGFLKNCRVLNNETTMEVPSSSYSNDAKEYEGWGAGVFLSGESILYNCVFNGNKSASRCGGVYVDCHSSILNCVVTNNEAKAMAYNGIRLGGAGVYAWQSRIYNTTVANNKLIGTTGNSQIEGAGAGMFLNNASSTFDNRVAVRNCIVWGNVYEYGTTTASSQIGLRLSKANATEARYNISNSAVQNADIRGHVLNNPTTNWITFNTSLGALTIADIMNLESANNGASSGKYYPRFIYPNEIIGIAEDSLYNVSNWSLRHNSDCIDKGENNYYLSLADYPQDVVGNPRIDSASGIIDIGAFEYTYFSNEIFDTIYVTQTGSGNGKTWLTSFGDLQAAVDSAYSWNQYYISQGMSNRVQVWVAAGEYFGDLVPAHNAFEMKDGVMVYGGFKDTDNSLDDRDTELNKTVLSGFETQRVLAQISDFATPTYWDGFVIEKGNTTGSEYGAGAKLMKNGVLNQCVIRNNEAERLGGGVYVQGGALIINSSITGNKAQNGSGLYLNGAGATVEYCEIKGNEVTALNNTGYTLIGTNDALVKHCSVINNLGGGINVGEASKVLLSKVMLNSYRGIEVKANAKLINMLVSNNGNGGIVAQDSCEIYNCTVVRNYISPDSTGVAGVQLDSCLLKNTVVWGNKKGEKSSQFAAVNHSIIGYNAIQDSTVVNVPGQITIILEESTNTNINLGEDNFGKTNTGMCYPFFAYPTDSAGCGTNSHYTVAEWHMFPGSSLYNKGTSDTAGMSLPKVDLNNEDRKQFGCIDIGAYETQWPNTYIYNKVYVVEGGLGNRTGVTWENAMPTIQKAVDVALAIEEDLDVWVAKGNYYGTEKSENAFVVHDTIDVYGSFNGNESVDYDLSLRDFENNASVINPYPGKNQHILVQPYSADIHNITIDGFVITDGNTDGLDAADGVGRDGAGVFARSNITLKNITVKNNKAVNGRGGGIFANGDGVVKLINCKVINNYADNDGGGIYGDSIVLVNAYVANNTSADSAGGVFARNGSILVNNTIARNLSTNAAAVVTANTKTGAYNRLVNNIIWGNKKGSSIEHNQFVYDNADYNYILSNSIQDRPYSLAQNNPDSLVKNNEGLLVYDYVFFADPTDTCGALTVYDEGDWRIRNISVCYNSGMNTIEGFVMPTTDISGNPRIASVGKIIDKGAYENRSPLENYRIVYVTTPGNGLHDGSSWKNAFSSEEFQLALLTSYRKIDTVRHNYPPVWVATGPYMYQNTGEESTIVMYDGVDVFGSFDKSEVPDYTTYPYWDMAQREIGGSILAGDDGVRALT